MNNEINILFLGGAKRVSLAERLIAAGKQLGRTVNIFSYELDKYVPISGVGKIISGLKWKDPEIFNHLQKTIEENNIHILLPYVDPATIVAAGFKPKSNIFIPVSDLAVCETFFNKTNAQEWFLKNGFPVPLAKQKLPMIAKPVTGSASQGIMIIKSQTELSNFENDYNQSDYVLQQYIDADEYTVDCYIDGNYHLLTAVPRKRLEVTAGEVTKSITQKEDKIIEMAASIIAKSKLRGPVNVQFLKEKNTGEIFVMEVNPRFGGGVINSIEAGADIAAMLLKEYLGIPNKPVTDWKENLLMMRANREFFTICN